MCTFVHIKNHLKPSILTFWDGRTCVNVFVSSFKMIMQAPDKGMLLPYTFFEGAKFYVLNTHTLHPSELGFTL